tara:strand:- start:803 stop:2014 length:1212 start_codon:yes stop_codon:yes gene_type:complete
MTSIYKPIGDFIQLVDERNKDLTVKRNLGLSISKEFIPTVGNTVGTNMANYKVVKRNQFACSLMQVRRDKKMPVALLRQFDQVIISPAYPVFKVIDEEVLLPEYLMMWFSREEFDRHACFLAVGGVRGSLEWDDFMEMKLPVPSIEKQRAIVKEYQTVTDRIKLNEQLNQKLEETAQAIYRHWFVDFEFPNEDGLPYKSSGGEMVYNDELDQDLPVQFSTTTLGLILESHSEKHNFKKDKLIFFNTSDILNGDFLHADYREVSQLPGQAKKSIKKHDILFSEIRPVNKRFALVRVEAEDYVVSTKLMVLRVRNPMVNHLRMYQFLTRPKFINQLQRAAEGRSGTFPQITFEEHLENYPFILGSKYIESKYEQILESYYHQLFARRDENKVLKKVQGVLLAKMA